MRAVENTLFVVVLPVYVLDPVFPLGLGGLLQWCDAGDRASKLDEGRERKSIDIRAQILDILGQRDVVWCRERESMVGEGCQLL